MPMWCFLLLLVNLLVGCVEGFIGATATGAQRGWTRLALSNIPEPEYGQLQHAGVLVSDTAKSLKFFTDILGFKDETHLRPDLPFDGAFVRAGAQQVHLMELPNPDPTEGRPAHGGRDRHLAFTIKDLEPLKERLGRASVDYTASKSGRKAIFTRDPDGNAFEFLETDT